jgi:hypothetical protein
MVILPQIIPGFHDILILSIFFKKRAGWAERKKDIRLLGLNVLFSFLFTFLII